MQQERLELSRFLGHYVLSVTCLPITTTVACTPVTGRSVVKCVGFITWLLFFCRRFILFQATFHYVLVTTALYDWWSASKRSRTSTLFTALVSKTSVAAKLHHRCMLEETSFTRVTSNKLLLTHFFIRPSSNKPIMVDNICYFYAGVSV